MRRVAAVIAVIGILSCSSESSPPTQPTPPATPAPPVRPVVGWSVSGTLVDTAGRQAIPGATITPSWDLAAVQTGSDGAFELGAVANPPTTPYKVSISGSDLLTREVWITWQQGPRAGVGLDAIRDRPPFSLEFYRQFVRGTFDNDGPYANFRWMEGPRFYLRTVDQNGRAVEPEVLVVVREALVRAVREFSGGTLSAAALDEGTDVRAPATGWINVDIRRDPEEESICGFALVGANPGSITFNNDVCSCGSNKIPGSLVLHEVGHALGFFHVPDRNSVMYPFLPGNCPAGQLSPAEKYHAAIAYSRPRGNQDPDVDPSAAQFVVSGQPITVTN